MLPIIAHSVMAFSFPCWPNRTGVSINLNVSHANAMLTRINATRSRRDGASPSVIRANDSNGQCHKYSG